MGGVAAGSNLGCGGLRAPGCFHDVGEPDSHKTWQHFSAVELRVVVAPRCRSRAGEWDTGTGARVRQTYRTLTPVPSTSCGRSWWALVVGREGDNAADDAKGGDAGTRRRGRGARRGTNGGPASQRTARGP
jgi:hypothetical protein